MKADKKTVLNLVRTAKGQLDGIVKMIEEDRYCIDVSTQLMATDAILRKANALVLESHVSGCIREAAKEQDSAACEAKIDEIVHILEKLTK